MSFAPSAMLTAFLFLQHGRDASMVASRSANRNRGFRALGWELFRPGIPFLTSIDIVLVARTRDTAPPRAGLLVAGLPVGKWHRSQRMGAFRY